MALVRRYRELLLAVIIALMIGAIGLRAPVFLTRESLLGVLNDTGFLFILALGQLLVILTRGIDLSVAANLALTGMLTGMVNQVWPDLPAAAYLALALVIGLGLGLLNGLVIGGLGLPPIVVTLGTLAIYRGMVVVIGGGDQVNQDEMGPAFAGFPRLAFLGLSSVFWIAVIAALSVQLFLTRTRAGRGLYAVGGNPVAARYCGIALERCQVLVFALSGMLAGLTGYLWVARYGVAYSEVATGYELTVIAACVIGGVSIAGGVGTVAGTLLGALFLGVIVNALPVMQVSPFWQMAISGAVILAAVILNMRAEARPDKLILPEARQAAAGGLP
ncbi:MAG TPA: ABC transporter permease [Paracoccaceae bacterium]|nr:ABC transporter permease [Paracoccaceae bacterium]